MFSKLRFVLAYKTLNAYTFFSVLDRHFNDAKSKNRYKLYSL